MKRTVPKEQQRKYGQDNNLGSSDKLIPGYHGIPPCGSYLVSILINYQLIRWRCGSGVGWKSTNFGFGNDQSSVFWESVRNLGFETFN